MKDTSKLSEAKKGAKNPMYGKKWSEAQRKVLTRPKEFNPLWKGDKVGYRAVHSFIERHYGKPTTCEHCQTTNLVGRQIHWASKTQSHTRNRENWMRLCSKCHGIYDKLNNLRQRKK